MRNQEEKDDKKQQKPDEAGSSENKTAIKTKEKKSLKFFIKPEESEDSFASALSSNANSSINSEDPNEVLPMALHSNLSKHTYSPRVYAKPRVACKRTCLEDVNEFFLHAISSELLRSSFSDPQCSDDVNMRLIHAIFLRNVNDAKKAIANGANVNFLFSFESPLLIATEIGDADMISYLLTVPHINMNQKNRYGQAALSVAVRNSFDLIVSLLLNVRVDVNTQDHLGRTPLHNALFQEQKNMVYRLLAFHANVEIEDCFGERAVYTAAVKKPNNACLTALLMEGASTNYMNFSKIPLISRVIMNATQFSIIETLIEFGASVNQPDLTSRTPLHYAALSNHLQAAKILIENGADISVKSFNDFTALDEAKVHCSKDVINYLESLQPQYSEATMTAMKKFRNN